jgi:hypothetical protein
LSQSSPNAESSSSALHITELAVAPSKLSDLASAVQKSFQIALQNQREIDSGVYEVGGFCGRKFRLFLNTLIATIDDARYLEIGIYQGATFCAAISGNAVRAVGIDDWCWDKGQRLGSLFFANLSKHHSFATRVSILEQDFRSVDFSSIGSFNVMFYDGSHSEQDQYDGVCAPLKALDNEAVVIVDDWNLEEVRRGTMRAINDSQLRISYALEVRTSFDNTVPAFSGGHSDWHNGTYVAVVDKP